MVMLPGVSYNANFVMIVNGAPSNTAAYRIEGLDNTNHTVNYALQENQPSSDAIQEIAVQTSNYAPEFGQAGGGRRHGAGVLARAGAYELGCAAHRVRGDPPPQ